MTSENEKTEEFDEDDVAQDIVCANCSEVQSSGTKFCAQCGQELSSDVVAKRSRRRRQPPGMAKKKLEDRKNNAQVKSGRNAILSVAIFILICYIFFDNGFSRAVMAIKSDPDMMLDEEAIESSIMRLNIITYVLLGLGVSYFGLFVWSFKNPFSALIVSIAIYILFFGVSLVIYGLPHFLLLIIEVMMLCYLVIGIKGCLKIKAQDE